MTFYPFGDFAMAGYLRNFEKEKDLEIVKRAENSSFTTGLDEAFELLAKSKQLTYEHVLQTHGILFGAVYPWADQDRLVTTPRLSIRKAMSFLPIRQKSVLRSSSLCVKDRTKTTWLPNPARS